MGQLFFIYNNTKIDPPKDSIRFTVWLNIGDKYDLLFYFVENKNWPQVNRKKNALFQEKIFIEYRLSYKIVSQLHQIHYLSIETNILSHNKPRWVTPCHFFNFKFFIYFGSTTIHLVRSFDRDLSGKRKKTGLKLRTMLGLVMNRGLYGIDKDMH